MHPVREEEVGVQYGIGNGWDGWGSGRASGLRV